MLLNRNDSPNPRRYKPAAFHPLPAKGIFSVTGGIAGASTVPVARLWPYVISPNRWNQTIPNAFQWATAQSLIW